MRSLIYLLYLICFSVFLSQSISQTSLPDPTTPPESPSSLVRKHDTALIAAPDGTIYLVELTSGEVLWSFDSGPSIYSSYQAISHDGNGHNYSKQSYVDCGDDWELYMHGNGLKEVKLPFSVEEFIRRTPYISDEGGVMLGTKKSTVFVVDATSGKLIYTIQSDAAGVENSSENLIVPKLNGSAGLESVDQLLYITRTDYGLKYTSLETGKEIWYLMFADIEASYQCQGILNFFSEGDGFDPEYKGVNCQARPIVYRIRDYSSLESIFGPDGILNSRFVDGALPLPAPVRKPLLEEHKERLPAAHQYNNEQTSLALRSTEIVRTGMLDTNGRGDIGETNIKWMLLTTFVLVLSTGAFVFWRSQLAVLKKNKMDKDVGHVKMQATISKKKKIRKSAINNRNRATTEDDERNIKQLTPNSDDGLRYGRKIGKLVVTNKEIAKGSNGTIVLEGTCDGRSVAVKRLVQTHHDVALKEIQNLIASDHHPNIIRWYGVEYDQDFVYLALERCACNLHDFILSCATSRKQGGDCFSNYNISFQSSMEKRKNFALWKANGYPAPLLLKVMREIVCGVAHLHELGIIHRDLKPQNVLILGERSICAKISDMGISKHLDGNMSSLTKHATGYGTSGWQAPEQLANERQTRAVDLFSLGCVLFFCITGGKHPFGDNLERDFNIVNDRKDLFLIDTIPEAVDLVSCLLERLPGSRPKAEDVLHHPLFWSSEMRLSFLRDASDRVELEDRENDSQVLKALESIGTVALDGKWDEKLESAFINDIGRYRRYKYDSVRDLLRVIRNKLNHYRELPDNIQAILGQVPEGFDAYFSTRFPKLLTEVYRVILQYCGEEEFFHKYFNATQI
jgi:serine/threonine-protein kinase/endoribonuclease IRE1